MIKYYTCITSLLYVIILLVIKITYMEGNMKIADKIEMLEISSTIMEKLETIYPTLMWDDHNTILIDTGYPNQLEKFLEAMHHADVSFNRLNKIIITHHDIDHMGSLSIITVL